MFFNIAPIRLHALLYQLTQIHYLKKCGSGHLMVWQNIQLCYVNVYLVLPEGLYKPLHLLSFALDSYVCLKLPESLVQLHHREVHFIHHTAGRHMPSTVLDRNVISRAVYFIHFWRRFLQKGKCFVEFMSSGTRSSIMNVLYIPEV